MIEISVYRDILDGRRARRALEAADHAYESGNSDEAVNHYKLYLLLGGDPDVIAPRLNDLRRRVGAPDEATVKALTQSRGH
jgi:hypothetical protein